MLTTKIRSYEVGLHFRDGERRVCRMVDRFRFAFHLGKHAERME